MQQTGSGEISWSSGEKTDPWDHIEALMGLSIAGYIEEARKGFQWLTENQLADGSWYSSYINGEPGDRTIDANFTAYIAVGVFHHYLITTDINFLKKMWPHVYAAMEFVLKLQADTGEIYWGVSPEGKVDQVGLLTGSSSIYMSLKCAIAISTILHYEMARWKNSSHKLGKAISRRPELFDQSKFRYSMDWFYPVLCGAVSGDAARQRIRKYWEKFVIPEMGVRCVADEPWVTIAETSELILTLCAIGDNALAATIFQWIAGRTFEDKTFWCGFTVPNIIIWPEEKVTWTNAVVLMAADALFNLTPASQLFHHDFWKNYSLLQ